MASCIGRYFAMQRFHARLLLDFSRNASKLKCAGRRYITDTTHTPPKTFPRHISDAKSSYDDVISSPVSYGKAAGSSYVTTNSSTPYRTPVVQIPDTTTHFGYQEIPAAEKEERVRHVFTNVSQSYDLMNDVMSFGVHRLWKDQMVRRIAPTPNIKLLDVAGGTGDVAFRAVRYALGQKNYAASMQRNLAQAECLPLVTVCDINESMLSVGEKRAASMDFGGRNTPKSNITKPAVVATSDADRYLRWIVGDAERLPFEDNSYDVYTIAFGIRNVTNIDAALKEAYRVLKPNGRFVCLEFSHVKNVLLEWLYDQYSFQVIPPMGLLLAQDWHSYQYLVESIRMFPTQDKFKEMIEQAGFRAVSYENMTNGLVAIHSGFKLPESHP